MFHLPGVSKVVESNGCYFDLSDAKERVDEFVALYKKRPIVDNSGGMKFNHSFATWFMLQSLKPKVVIESGVWKGHSTWLIEQACPDARIFCLDLNFSRLQYRSAVATYIQKDFSECSWSSIDPASVVCFFDDHENSYARLKDMYWVGFTRAIFEDNFPCGEGDCYSLRHMLGGFGHPHLQMSKQHLEGLAKILIRFLFELVVKQAGSRQQLIVKPNTADRDNFRRNCKYYFEFPPIVREPLNNWGGCWEGSYSSVQPLLKDSEVTPDLQKLRTMDANVFGYGYIAFVDLQQDG